jgi:hypothetical protein
VIVYAPGHVPVSPGCLGETSAPVAAMIDAGQAALVKSRLDLGIANLREQEMHEVVRCDFLAALARAHSSLVLPIIEAKIEEVFQSRNPIECFTNKSVVRETFLGLASLPIAQAADVEALKQAGKLQKLNAAD